MSKAHRAEIIAAYNEYLKAFIGNDIDGINACVQFPIAYVGDGKVSMLDEFPVKPADLKAAKGWVTTDSFEMDVVAVGENKAHLLMRNCRRLREDGSLIEEASAFYAYTKTTDGWKIYALSDIVFPAQL